MSQDPLPSVTVIIPTKNRPRLLDRALTSILDDQAASEVIVVVDGQDRSTIDLLRRRAEADRRVRFTHTPPPDASGLNSVQRGRDHGVRLATSDVILAFDDDETAHAKMVTGHARWHGRRDDLVVVGYVPVVTPRRWPHAHAPVSFYSAAYEGDTAVYRSDPDSILRALWGGNTSLRRTHWLKAIEAGRIECYLDDKQFGLCLLQQQQGLQGVFDPELRADHWYGCSLRRFADRARKTVIAHAQLRAAYSEILGGSGPQPWHRRRLQKMILRLGGPSAGWFVIRWLLITGTWTASALRLSRLEDAGARALWRVATERAALEAPQAVSALDLTPGRAPAG